MSECDRRVAGNEWLRRPDPWAPNNHVHSNASAIPHQTIVSKLAPRQTEIHRHGRTCHWNTMCKPHLSLCLGIKSWSQGHGAFHAHYFAAGRFRTLLLHSYWMDELLQVQLLQEQFIPWVGLVRVRGVGALEVHDQETSRPRLELCEGRSSSFPRTWRLCSSRSSSS